MNIETQHHDNDSAGLVLSGRFDAFETDAFRATIDPLLASESTAKVRVTMADVNFIDSSGLAELVRSMKRAREAGGDIELHNPSDPVRVILELTRLDLAFTITSAE